MKRILICGWIRSGTRYLSRLLTYYFGYDGNLFQEKFWFGDAQVRYLGEDIEIRKYGHSPRPTYGTEQDHVVHIFRDPRDTFVSWYHFLLDVPNNMWGGGTWKEYLPWLVGQSFYDFREYAESWLECKEERPPHMSWITHEEIVADRAAAVLRLVSEAGYLPDPSQAEYAAQMSAQEPFRHLYYDGGPPRRGTPGEWKHLFDTKDARLIDHYYGDLIEQLGYGTESEWKALLNG